MLLLFFCPFFLSAQQPAQLNFTTRDGLPSSEVYDVLQDAQGYIWFATDAGVSRYDGYHFHNYTTADNLPDNTVFGMYEDHRGRIWFYTYSGRLSYWEHDSIHPLPVNAAITKVHGSDLYTSFYVDPGDTIWCGMQGDKGFYKILPGYREQDLQIVPASGYYLVQLSDKPDSPIIWGCAFRYGRTSIYGLFLYNKTKLTDSVYTDRKFSGTPRAFIKAGTKIFGDMQGLAVFGDSSYSVSIANSTGLRSDHEGCIWAATVKRGVYRMLPDAMHRSTDLHLFDGCSVTDVLQDREGGYWITTIEKGVYYLPSLQCRVYTEENSIPAKHIYNISNAGDGVCAFYFQDYIAKITDSIHVIANNPQKIPILFGSPWGSGQVLLSGMMIYHRSDGTFVPLKSAPSLGDLSLYAAAYAGNGCGWAMNRDKLLRIDGVNKTVTVAATLPGRCTAMCLGPGDTLWLGGARGLWKYAGGNFYSCGTNQPLFRNRVDAIAMAPDSSMWLATRGSGLIMCKGKQVTQLTVNDGLPSMICRAVCVDHDTVWVGTNAGLCFVKRNAANLHVERFVDQHWMLSNDIRTICRTDQKLWTLTGTNLVSYEIPYVSTPVAPPVYITQCAINGSGSLQTARTVSGDAGNNVEIAYVGLSYASNGHVLYRYRLAGLDTAWQHSENTSIRYSSLPPGTYTFEVYATGVSGTESKLPARINFIILPPFRQTWWFLGLLVLAIAGVIFLLFRLRLRSLHNKTRLEHRIALLELSALRAQMNPHFIFNAINSIQQFILENDRKSAQKYLSMFARLIRRVLENSRHDAVTLKEEVDALALYVELEQLRFSSRFEYVQEYAPGLNPDRLRIPPMLVQPFVENAILHGLVPLENRTGKLLLRFDMNDDRLHVTIDDNGIGREAARQNKARKELQHTSVGLSVTQKRLDMLNLGSPEKVTVLITDKYDATGLAAGTRVEIFIPLS